MGDLRSELLAIKTKHGKLTPGLVVKEAAKTSHPLHSRFEWDDDVAGEKYRLLQARELIAKVQIKWVDAKGDTRTSRGFYAIRSADADEYDYDQTEEILKDPFRRRLLLNDMQRRVDELVQQFAELDEFWDYLRGVTRRKRRKSG